MSGIGGIVQFANKSINATPLHNIMSAMSHRGINSKSIFLLEKDYSIGLGQRWSGINTLSELKDKQLRDNSILVIFDGRIYNYSELREKLENKGYRFRFGNFVELIKHLYEEYGIECLHDLHGVFTFALWDKVREKLFIARDRIGIKPLYYYKNKNLLLFASEVKAILATNLVEKKLNPYAVLGYLTFQSVQDPDTVIQRIHSLLPGYYMIAQKDNILVKNYWEIPLLTQHVDEVEENDIYKKTRELLEATIKLEIADKISMGVFLSGGIDSTVIVALMSGFLKSPVNTFSLVFPYAKYDESEFARLVSRRFNTNHTEFYIDQDEVITNLPEIIQKMDQPSVDGINTYIISKAVRAQGIKVAFSGIGGDDVFIDYDFFKQKLFLIKKFTVIWNYFLPSFARNCLTKVLNSVKTMNVAYNKFIDYLDSQTFFIDLYFMTRKVFWKNILKDILDQKFKEKLDNDVSYSTKYMKNLQDNVEKIKDDMNKISYLDCKTYVPNTLLRDADSMGMANSLEIRAPLLDHKLIEYIATIPGKLKVDKNIPRKLEVKALGDLLPEEVVYRTPAGFVLPFEKWLKDRMGPIVEQVLTKKTICKRGIFSYTGVNKLWQKFLTGNVHWTRIWIIVVLELWCQKHID